MRRSGVIRLKCHSWLGDVDHCTAWSIHNLKLDVVQGYHLLADWVRLTSLDLGCSTVLLGQHRSYNTAQRPVEHTKSKSTQPRSAWRWVTLYPSQFPPSPVKSAIPLQVTREVAKRTDDLTHQVHRETLSRSIEQVKTLAPILICSMKIFIQIIQQGKQYGSLSKSRRGSREKTKSGQRFYPRSRRDEAGGRGENKG